MTKLNKPLIRRMIKRIETMPETYKQSTVCATPKSGPRKFENRPMPACGTVACLAGEAVICSEPTVTKGLNKLNRSWDAIYLAQKLMGVESAQVWIFGMDASSWPDPFRRQFDKAKTYKGEARAAINLLRAILKTDGKILEGQ